MERRGPREEEGNTGNKKALPGTRMGSAGRTGSRNKRFGDKKMGFPERKLDGNPGNEKGPPGSQRLDREARYV